MICVAAITSSLLFVLSFLINLFFANEQFGGILRAVQD